MRARDAIGAEFRRRDPRGSHYYAWSHGWSRYAYLAVHRATRDGRASFDVQRWILCRIEASPPPVRVASRGRHER